MLTPKAELIPLMLLLGIVAGSYVALPAGQSPVPSTASANGIAVQNNPASAAASTGSFLGVLTYHNNNSRTGLNAHETVLTPGNVNPSQFGKLFTYNLDGDVHG